MKNINVVMLTNYINANGQHPLLLVLSTKEKSKKINLSIYVNPKHWNKKNIKGIIPGFRICK